MRWAYTYSDFGIDSSYIKSNFYLQTKFREEIKKYAGAVKGVVKELKLEKVAVSGLCDDPDKDSHFTRLRGSYLQTIGPDKFKANWFSFAGALFLFFWSWCAIRILTIPELKHSKKN